jgi:hypothetical protein
MKEHTDSQYCWCKPELVFVSATGAQVWVHHEPDGNTPPPEVVAEAIALTQVAGDEEQIRPLAA